MYNISHSLRLEWGYNRDVLVYEQDMEVFPAVLKDYTAQALHDMAPIKFSRTLRKHHKEYTFESLLQLPSAAVLNNIMIPALY